jgi:dihydrofolate synthase / folylpolyglutamate synthase
MSKKTGGYQSALRFILSREMFGMKLGLENISDLLDKMDNPQNKFHSIHIAGTNGKGSTAAYIDSILRQAGYKTALFTSPHLVDFRERIKVNGALINEAYITRFIEKYKKLIARKKITFFEVCTALAFSYFADKKVDIAVIETGLGGRLDATNTLRPLLSIITDISYDHTSILGKTLPKIAFEKAGIIKESVPVLIGILPSSARQIIAKTARRRSASLASVSPGDFSRSGRDFSFDYHRDGLMMRNLRSSLPGRHQVTNAAVAVQAIGMLGDSGFRINRTDIRKGLENTYWPGRFQFVRRRGKPLVILDVGHNPAGAGAMAACFREMFPRQKADMVIGLVNTKDLRRTIKPLIPIVKRVAVARLDTPRTAAPGEIASLFNRKVTRVETFARLTTAARKMINSAALDDIIIVCGSHYGVGEFMAEMDMIYER